MRYLILFFLLFLPFNVYTENKEIEVEQPSLLESLKIFFEKNGGSIEDLNLEKNEAPITKVESSIKNLLQEVAEDEKEETKE